ncbi:MAG: hypothetical protein HamCj_00800 [Candidatus Hamiltonella defensa (Ceratovacuna japonica)]
MHDEILLNAQIANPFEVDLLVLTVGDNINQMLGRRHQDGVRGVNLGFLHIQ